jgi:hypothetical protein
MSSHNTVLSGYEWYISIITLFTYTLRKPVCPGKPTCRKLTLYVVVEEKNMQPETDMDAYSINVFKAVRELPIPSCVRMENAMTTSGKLR